MASHSLWRPIGVAGSLHHKPLQARSILVNFLPVGKAFKLVLAQNPGKACLGILLNKMVENSPAKYDLLRLRFKIRDVIRKSPAAPIKALCEGRHGNFLRWVFRGNNDDTIEGFRLINLTEKADMPGMGRVERPSEDRDFFRCFNRI